MIIPVATPAPVHHDEQRGTHRVQSAHNRWRSAYWLLIALLHYLSISYHGVMAFIYLFFGSVLAPFGPNKYVESVFIDKRHFPVIGAGAACLCFIHVVMLARMVVTSLLRRRLTFLTVQDAIIGHSQLASRLASAADRGLQSSFGKLEPLAGHSGCGVMLRYGPKLLQGVRTIGAWLHFCFIDRRGLLGIDGPYIDGVFVAREIFQVGYQSIQAWRMSERVPIAWLNRFNVILVCLNCWSLPVLEWWITRRAAPTGNRHGPTLGKAVRYRLPSMLVDCLLDSLAVSLMSIVILTPYARTFNRTMKMFPPSLWRNDKWLVRVISEFPIVLVVNWVDGVSRVVFALLTVLSLYTIHELCHAQFERGPVKTSTEVRVLSRDPSQLIRTRSPPSFARRAVRLVLMVWGVVVAILHIYASWRQPPSHCVLPLQPWAESKPACAAVQFNCYRSDSNGSRSSIEPVFQAISSQYVLLIILEHCPSLEMPRTLQSHSHLVSMTIHNSTINNWGRDTAFISTHHPRLRALQFSRITWPDGGQLPDGLVGPSFPQSVEQVLILESNLHTLPANLHEIWPQHMSFACDACRLSNFPPTLLKLNLIFLSLADNNLTNLPLPDLLGPTKDIIIIGASFNPITALGAERSSRDPGLSKSLMWLVLKDTHLTSLPSWAAKDTPSVVFLMGGSPLCESVNLAGLDPTVKARVDCTPPTPSERSDINTQDKLHPL